MLNITLHDRFYADDDRPSAPTAAENKEHVLECADALRRSTFGSEEGRESLADLLENCDPGHRCGSAACVMCGTAAKWLLVERVDILWRHSIDHRTGDEEWTPHIHILTPVDGSEGLTPALASALEFKGRVPFPVQGRVVRDRNRRVTYVFKPRPQRAVRYATYGANARPTKHWLKRLQQVEALLRLGRNSALYRAVLINLGPRTSAWRVEDIRALIVKISGGEV